MRTIFLSAGHHPSAPGAHNGDFIEHFEAVKWIDKINEMLKSKNIKTIVVPTGTLKSKVEFINIHSNRGDIAIELHFNSNVNARGSETLYCPGSINGEKLALIMQKHLSTVFLPDRGIKEGYYQGDKAGNKKLYFLIKSSPVALILEPEFVFNKDKIIDNFESGCESIVNAICEMI